MITLIWSLSGFLIKKGLTCDTVDTILFIKLKDLHILLLLIYIDDSIFGFTMCREFSNVIYGEFEMSLTRTQLLLRFSNQANGEWNFHKPYQILLKTAKEIWHE